jgi:hypothetical protein
METFPLNNLAEKFEVDRSVMVKAMRNVPPDLVRKGNIATSGMGPISEVPQGGPLYPQEQTWSGCCRRSGLCQEATSETWLDMKKATY